jgi:hypothetical protein
VPAFLSSEMNRSLVSNYPSLRIPGPSWSYDLSRSQALLQPCQLQEIPSLPTGSSQRCK